MTSHPVRALPPTTVGRTEILELAAGPVLFAIGLAITYFISEIGPLDRAKVQGFIGLPLMAVGPGLAGLAGRRADGRARAQFVIRATAALIGFVALWATAVSVTFVRCRPVTSPIDVLPDAVAVGLLAAMTYGVAGTAALGYAARGKRWVAVLIGTGSFIGLAAISVLVIAVVLFPPSSCAPPLVYQ